MVCNIRFVKEACIKKKDGFVIFGQYQSNNRGLCGVNIRHNNITLPGTLTHFEKKGECGNQDFHVEFMLNTDEYVNELVDIIFIKNNKTEIVLKSQLLSFPFEEIKKNSLIKIIMLFQLSFKIIIIDLMNGYSII